MKFLEKVKRWLTYPEIINDNVRKLYEDRINKAILESKSSQDEKKLVQEELNKLTTKFLAYKTKYAELRSKYASTIANVEGLTMQLSDEIDKSLVYIDSTMEKNHE